MPNFDPKDGPSKIFNNSKFEKLFNRTIAIMKKFEIPYNFITIGKCKKITSKNDSQALSKIFESYLLEKI